MVKKWQRLTALAAVGALAGCGGITTIRALPPAAIMMFPGEYDGLANCFHDELKTTFADGHYQLSKRGTKPIAYVSSPYVTVFGTPQNMYAWEVSLTQASEEAVEVVLRSRRTVWGGLQAQDNLFALVERCSEESG